MFNLSVCMIIKDEQDVLNRCLDCVKQIADEIIIVDTGSTDNSINIAKEYTDHIYHYEWNNNFAHARNFSYSKATCDYIMWIDADDIITDENIKKINDLKLNLDENIDVLYFRYNDWNEESLFNFFYRERISKRQCNLLWKYNVHEVLDINPKLTTKLCKDIAVEHKKQKRDKNEDRNLKLLDFAKYEEKDGFDYTKQLYLIKELWNNNKFDKAINVYQNSKPYFNKHNIYIPLFYAGWCHIYSKKYEELLKEIEYAKNLGMTIFDTILFLEAVAYESMKKIDKAELLYNKCIYDCRSNLDNCSLNNTFYYGYNNYFPYLRLVNINIYRKNLKKAKEYLEKAKQLYPDDNLWKVEELRIVFNEG